MGKLLLRKLSSLLLVLALAGMVGLLAGCEGDDGAPGASGQSAYDLAVANGTFTGTLDEWLLQEAGVEPEACATCHTGDPIRSGQAHQDFYDDLFQLGVINVTLVEYVSELGDADGDPATPDVLSDVVTFKMTKMGADFDCTMADSLNIYFTEYTGVNNMEFTSIDLGTDNDPDGDRLSIKGNLVYDGAGGCTSTKAQSTRGDLAAINGIIAVYGQDEEILPIKPENVELFDDAHISLARFPFGTIIETGAGVDYVSAANASDCEKCHISPYFKHGYIVGDVGQGVGNLDFYTCKACHIDNGSGGHEDWQIIVDNPQRWADIFLNDLDLTPAEEAQYAYTTRLMNDVHMSHAMEFPYPQSMANCATCHSGKLAQTLTDENFTLQTCKSCHPITGGTDTVNADGDLAVDTRLIALSNLITRTGFGHSSVDLTLPDFACNNCHNDGGEGELKLGPSFSEIHTGYNPIIYYDTAGGRYNEAFVVTIDDATLVGTDLTISFSATENPDVPGLAVSDIVPSVFVAAYGYDTKDFIVSSHARDADRNRLGEFTFGEVNPYFSNAVDNDDGTWSVTFDTTAFDAEDRVDAGAIRRLEIAVLPELRNAAGDLVGMDAPSRTFNMDTGAFEANYFQGTNAIVSEKGVMSNGAVVTKGCNSCHDQLATTFHSPIRGGNIVVCRMCHVVTNGGSHLEGQSRSIDSYVHAVHSFQAFDVDEVDFTDPVEAAHYEEHVNFFFPDFAIVNCMACHTDERAIDGLYRAAFDVPDQSYSMPGLLSATDEIPGVIPATTPEVVTGPAARACGGCHRARFINQDNAGGFASFNQHTKANGYRVDNDADDNTLYAIISFIMSMFE